MKPSRPAPILAALALFFAAFFTACGASDETVNINTSPDKETPEAVSSLSENTDIIISEFMEKNKAVIRDEDGDFSDWIELYNNGNDSVSLLGWSISDKEDKPGWVFPDTCIAPGDYLLIFASGKDKSDNELHTDFSLKGNEGVFLYAPDGVRISEAFCGNCEADVSMAYIDGCWQQTMYPTPGIANTSDGYRTFQNSLAPIGPLVINEAVVFNLSGFKAGEAGYTDWVEIKNISDSDILLSDYCLSDDDDNYALWQLPAVTLRAGGITVFVCDVRPADYSGSYCFTGFSLNSASEQLYLSDSNGLLLDYASLRDIPYDCSYGRMDGQSGWFFFDSPTPGADNNGGKRTVAVSPAAVTKDGVYNGIDSLLVELDSAGEIHYTLDGSRPTADSPLYSGPIELAKTCVVRSVSIQEDALCSRPLTQSFIINENHTLPVFCLNTDDPTSFDRMYNGMHKGIELPGALSMYREDSSFTIGCGVSLNGETSLIENKKNMSLRFRSAYGQESLNYDIYGGGVTEFTNLLLRSGQDFEHGIIRNELAQNLCDIAGCNVINQRSIYGILYINGEYRGIYTLKEKANEQLYASVAGVSRGSVELYEAPVPYGSTFYNDVIRFVQQNDVRIDENYSRFCEIMDVDNLIDWLIIEGFCANTDLSCGNVRYCRSSEDDGKWRIMFYDLDAAFLNEGSIYYNFMTEYGSQSIQFSTFVVPLMRNDVFKDKFLIRAGGLLRDKLTNEAVVNEIDRLHDEIAAEVPRDYGRFTMDSAEWEYNLESLRDEITRRDWNQLNIDALSMVFDLTDAEREHYFGDIDGR